MFRNQHLILLSVFACCMLIVRMLISNSFHFVFLPFNLLLAAIPLSISATCSHLMATLNQQQIKHRLLQLLYYKPFFQFVFISAFALWLLFLPNAPYLITDLLHLEARAPIPIYFDTMLLFVFALLGIVLFINTVSQMEALWRNVFPKRMLVFYGSAFVLCSFGIYLGRFARFNSWDVVAHPGALLYNIFVRIIYPLRHSRTWAVTILYTLSLALIYLLFTKKEVQLKLK